MFKEKCPRCNKEVKKNFAFCPYCSHNLNKEREFRDFGFLGKEDNQEIAEQGFGFKLNLKDIFKTVNAIANDLAKNMSSGNSNPKMINIDLSSGEKPSIKIDNQSKTKKAPIKMPKPQEFTGKKLKNFLEMKKSEPQTSLRRLSNKLIYEISLPGVAKKEDVIINKLEKGFEVKALGDKAYVKVIPFEIPMSKAKFNNQTLTLEFNA